MNDVTFYIKAFITFLVLINPLEGIPIYLGATVAADETLKKKISQTAFASVVIIMIASLFFGNAILKLFGISAGAFQIGGGIILFLVAVRMVLGNAKGSFDSMTGGVLKPSFGVVPLAIPIFAGPGAINGAVLYGTQAHSLIEMGILSAVIVLVGFITYASLRAALPIVQYIKETGIDIATRIMGLIIAAIAVEMIAHGGAMLFHLPVFS